MVSCDAVIDAPLVRIQETTRAVLRPRIRPPLQIPWMIRFWDMTNVHNKRMPCHFLVFGTLFHKVIVAQLSDGRNTVFAKVL
jgi:hypothetical protein